MSVVMLNGSGKYDYLSPDLKRKDFFNCLSVKNNVYCRVLDTSYQINNVSFYSEFDKNSHTGYNEFYQTFFLLLLR